MGGGMVGFSYFCRPIFRRMIGELFAIGVAFLWSGSAIFFDYVNRTLSALNSNLIRFFFGFFPITILLLCISGDFFFAHANFVSVLWIASAGFVGFVFGDYFLFASYKLIHASYTQLIMTLSPLFAALTGFLLLGERLTYNILLGMLVTLFGIALTIVRKPESAQKFGLAISKRGIFFAVLSALGQGVGLVLSKKGLAEYHLSAGAACTDFYISIAATQIRIITGFVCFLLIVMLRRGGARDFVGSFRHPKPVAASCAGAFLGLGVGVPLSLLALQYTQTAIVSTIIATVPIIILLYNRIFKKRKITVKEAVGVLLSVAGVAVLFL